MSCPVCQPEIVVMPLHFCFEKPVLHQAPHPQVLVVRSGQFAHEQFAGALVCIVWATGGGKCRKSAHTPWLSCSYWGGYAKHFKGKKNLAYFKGYNLSGSQQVYVTSQRHHYYTISIHFWAAFTSLPQALPGHPIASLPLFCCNCIADTSTKISCGITNYVLKLVVLIFRFC